MSLSRPPVLLALAALLAAPAACSDQSEAAKQALARADQAVVLAAAEATQYFPQRLQAVQARLANERAAYTQRRYADVLATAPAITADARDLISEAAARKDELIRELTTQWSQMANSVPQLLKSAADELQTPNSRRPATSATAVRLAQAALTDATALWQQAQMSVAAGRIEDGLKTAQQVQQKIAAVSTTLNARP